MTTPINNPFVRTWEITSWDDKMNPGLFPIGCELTISGVEPDLEIELVYKDSAPARNIPFPVISIKPGSITGTAVLVHGYASTMILTVDNPEKPKLNGKVTSIEVTGPAGTFIADASTGGEEQDNRRSPRWPRWLRWLRRLVRRLDKSLPEERIAA